MASKRRREAFNRATKQLLLQAVADDDQDVTGESPAVKMIKQETTTSDSTYPDSQNQNVEPSRVPLYAKNAAYALAIPCGINFLNIEDAVKWESDVYLEQSDTDPLSIGEDRIKKEYIVKEEVMPIPVDQFPVLPEKKNIKLENNDPMPTPVDQFPVLQKNKNIKLEANVPNSYAGTFPAFHFLSNGASLKMAYKDIYCDSSQDFKLFASQFIDKSAGSSSDVNDSKPLVLRQHCDVKTSSTADHEALFCCAICSAIFHHRRTIIDHMKSHFE